MDIDPIESVLTDEESKTDGKSRISRLNAAVAITVAILATFMGICKVKDDNIVQAMQQAQADKVDHWAFYQARNIREEIAKATLAELKVQLSTQTTPESRQMANGFVEQYEKLANDQAGKKEEVRKQAEQDQVTYDTLNFRDDQFDLSDTLIDIAIALLAITALTDIWLLYVAALIPACFGVAMGLSGLIGWSIHPDALIRLLS